jgi:hypothetical protein
MLIFHVSLHCASTLLLTVFKPPFSGMEAALLLAPILWIVVVYVHGFLPHHSTVSVPHLPDIRTKPLQFYQQRCHDDFHKKCFHLIRHWPEDVFLSVGKRNLRQACWFQAGPTRHPGNVVLFCVTIWVPILK